MAGKISGIVVEIGGNTSKLGEALKDASKKTKDLQGELKEVERALRLDPGNVELIAQRQEVLNDVIAQTSSKLDTLRQAQSQVEAQFQRGDIGAEQYRAFQRELSNTESSLQRYRNELNSIGAEQQRFQQAQQRMQNYLVATGQNAQDLSSTLGTRLATAIRDGTATSDQLEQALRRLGQAAGHTGDDLVEFNRILQNAGNNSNFDDIRRDLEQLGDAANEAENDVNGLGDALSSTVGALAAGGGLAGAVGAALSVDDLKARIDVQFDIPEESKAAVFEVVKGVQTYGFEAEEALEAVRRQFALNADASDEANARIVEGAGAIARNFSQIDLIELVQETNEVAAALEITNEEALALTDALLKAGFPPEQLDIISEYGTQMKEAGFSATETQAIFEKGIDTKTWNIDNLMDGVKEVRLQMGSFGQEVPAALDPLLEKAGMSSEQFQTWGKAVNEGGTAGSQALSDMVTWLNGIEDKTLQNEIATAAFGTKWEDQGQNMTAVFSGLHDAQDKTKSNAEGLQATIDGTNASPIVQLQQAYQNMMIALQPVFDVIANVVSKFAEWAAQNPMVTATVVAISTAIGILVGLFALLMPAIGTVVSLVTSGALSFGLLSGAMVAITGPVGLIIAALVAFGAALVLLWGQSETFRASVTTIFQSIRSVVTTVFQTVVSFLQQKFAEIVQFWNANGSQILAAVQNVFSGIAAVVNFVMPAVKFVIEYVWKAIQQVITGALNVIMGAIKVFSGLFTGDFSKMWEGVKQIFSGAISLVVGLMSLNFVGAIRRLLTGFVTSGVSVLRGMWSSITQGFSSLVSSVRGIVSGMVSSVVSLFRNIGSTATSIFGTMRTFGASMFQALSTAARSAVTTLVNGVKTGFSNMVSSIRSALSNALSTVKSIFTQMVAVFKPSALLQAGKDLIQGLINGIKGMGSRAIESITGVVNGVVDKAKSLLGIKSPSRVFKQIGEWVIEGWTNGVDERESKLISKMEDLAHNVLDISEHYAAEEVKLQEKLQQDIKKLDGETVDKVKAAHTKANEQIAKIQQSAAKKKKKLTVDENKQIGKLRADAIKTEEKLTTDAIKKKAEIESKAAKDSVNLLIQMDKDKLAEIKSYTQSMKQNGELSSKEEAAIWQSSLQLFDEYSARRIEAQKELTKSLEALDKELESTNKTYIDKMNKVREDYLKAESDANAELEKLISDRTKTYANHTKLWDEFKRDNEVTGEQLLKNLESQVWAMVQWRTQLDQLSTRGLDSSLFAEIKAMGVAAVDEVMALNKMTDAQIQQYNMAYMAQARWAREMAEEDYKETADATEKELANMKEQSIKELQSLEKEWLSEIDSIVNGTESTLKTLHDVGKKAAQQLIDGMTSMSGQLAMEAQKIGQTVSDNISSSLNVRDVNIKFDSNGIPQLRTGGVLSEGQAIIAEAGSPEMVTMMNGKAVVTPLTQRQKITALNSQNGSTVMVDDNANVVQKLTEVVNVLSTHLPKLDNNKAVVLDNGKLVGALKNEINTQLGDQAKRKGRGMSG